ncbi:MULTISPECIES: adenylyl-sulfate kinase [Methylophaga]|jgi:adenylyl-sulfate kinase|uniref:Adenylyl-sulfate kinase n=1 Tax=Methylophaga marina TaxID=45495 RepID=A0ABN0TLZ2_9GAMM|nr:MULTISPECIES: adenylyl-sulfate kinase [Methylophaga]BDZ74622.1 adenylyl-sulfate kinase [Methylophaga marina]|tara:strand:+ start:244 stop:834 length:591 start_codon:yes stop_codon:yes gene_type:complete
MNNIVWHKHKVEKLDRSKQKKQKPCILWFTGLSGAGKSTVADAVEQKLFELGHHTYLLDGDNVRHGLNKDLGFSDADRVENIRRIGEMAKLFADAGLIVMSAFISPFRSDRKLVRDLVEEKEFVEVYISTPLSTCEQRDPKGLYKKARSGQIKNFTGIDSEYEAPVSAEVTLNTAELNVDECVARVITYLKQNEII